MPPTEAHSAEGHTYRIYRYGNPIHEVPFTTFKAAECQAERLRREFKTDTFTIRQETTTTP